MTRYSIRALLFVLAAALAGQIALAAIPNDADSLSKLFDLPFPLLGVMYLGAIGSALKTVSTAKRDGSSISYAGYFAYWPETAAAAVSVFVFWLTLLKSGQLNFAAAAAYGAIANTGVDLLRSKGRSAGVAEGAGTDTPPKG